MRTQHIVSDTDSEPTEVAIAVEESTGGREPIDDLAITMSQITGKYDMVIMA